MAIYGSEIERIATQAANQSRRRTASTANMIQQYISQQQSRWTPFKGPPVGMGPGLNRGGPPGGGWDRMRIPKGMGPGVHGKIRPNAPIVTIRDGQGHSVQVNASVADEFKSFLRALKRTGYKIHSIGGYANRNIAGTSTRSLHSYGLAIDINPSANPVTYGRRQTNLPRGIGRLARRYGIAWGGNWNGSKKDTMHFSFPYFGTK